MNIDGFACSKRVHRLPRECRAPHVKRPTISANPLEHRYLGADFHCFKKPGHVLVIETVAARAEDFLPIFVVLWVPWIR